MLVTGAEGFGIGVGFRYEAVDGILKGRRRTGQRGAGGGFFARLPPRFLSLDHRPRFT